MLRLRFYRAFSSFADFDTSLFMKFPCLLEWQLLVSSATMVNITKRLRARLYIYIMVCSVFLQTTSVFIPFFIFSFSNVWVVVFERGLAYSSLVFLSLVFYVYPGNGKLFSDGGNGGGLKLIRQVGHFFEFAQQGSTIEPREGREEQRIGVFYGLQIVRLPFDRDGFYHG